MAQHAKALTRGVALADEISSMNLSSPAYRVAHTGADDFESFLVGIRKGGSSEAGAVCDKIRQRQAIISLDIPREYGASLEQAAKRVRFAMLVIVPRKITW